MFSEMHIYRESKITSVADAHPDETVRRVVDAVTGMDESTVLGNQLIHVFNVTICTNTSIS